MTEKNKMQDKKKIKKIKTLGDALKSNIARRKKVKEEKNDK
jgi:hypothetical protein